MATEHFTEHGLPQPADTEIADAKDIRDLSAGVEREFIPNDYLTSMYSKEEHDTGKRWIDGKSIYRKVISDIPMPQVVVNGTTVIRLVSVPQAKMFTAASGMVVSPAGVQETMIPSTRPGSSSTYTIGLLPRISEGGIQVESSNTFFNPYSAILILEYIKQ